MTGPTKAAFWRGREWSLVAALAAIAAVVGVVNPAFLSGGSVSDMLSACAPGVIVACGVALVIVVGEIDISVGSLYGFLGALIGVLASPSHSGWPVWAAGAAVLAAGAASGLVCGFLVTVWRVPAIVATLGAMTVLRGGTELLLQGEWVTDLPPGLRAVGTARWFGLSISTYVAAACVVAIAVAARRTRWGVRLYAVGSNAEAARLAGIGVRRVKIGAFVLAGVLTGVAALVSVPQLSVVDSGLGIGLELLAVTAAVVGGVSIRGGSGALLGVALAAVLLGIVRSALVFLKLGPGAAYWEQAIQGAFILGAVVIDRGRADAARLSVEAEEGVRSRVPPWVPAAAVLAAVMLAAWRLEPEFVAGAAQGSLLPQVAEVALLAVPMTLVVLMGMIDLSVGSMMALAAVVAGIAYERGAGAAGACGAAVVVGGLCGLMNGLFVTRWRIHPLVVTLATMALFRGLAEGISGGRPISGFGNTLASLGGAALVGVPVVLVPAILALGAAWVLLARGASGVWMRGVGFNETACRCCGVPVDRLKLRALVLSGLGAGLAAAVFMARRNTAKADIGQGIELEVITAVVLGGTSLAGGRGSIVGTLLGVLALHEIRQFVAWRWYHDELILVVIGAVLILSAPVTRWVATGVSWRRGRIS